MHSVWTWEKSELKMQLLYLLLLYTFTNSSVWSAVSQFLQPSQMDKTTCVILIYFHPSMYFQSVYHVSYNVIYTQYNKLYIFMDGNRGDDDGTV